MESRNLALELIGGSGLEIGEGSVAADARERERPSEVTMTKTCDNGSGCLENESVGKKEDVEKSNGDEGNFFYCNICLDLASDPVVTCCGHLFCWSCLYRWLHIHSDAKECPICKGEVTIKTVTPIYGRGNTSREPEEDSSLKIPHRPQARRIEIWSQTIQRNTFTIPMEEMIPRVDSPRELAERSNSLSNRILTSRGIRREQNTTTGIPDAAVDSTQSSSPTHSEAGESRRLSSLLARRSHRAATISNLTSALSSVERLVESYFSSHPMEMNQEQVPAVDDRDSVSSIVAIIQSESQTVDTAAEIDSTVSLSTSSSRRSERVSDVDSGDSRTPRRRRLH